MMYDAIKYHWPEYLIEAWCLGTFMVSACFFGVLLYNPLSPTAHWNLTLRNALMGLAMGSTAVAITCPPWGRRSGAHFNPAVTLAFYRLGKVRAVDAFFYVIFQFIGGTVGVIISYLVLGGLLANSAVNFVVTVPGSYGVGAAFLAELVIAFLLMTTILFTSNSVRRARYTPVIAGGLVATYITFESPISGMSMNPARTFASAAVAGDWTSWWIYFLAPAIAMLSAAEFYLRIRGLKNVWCAKLNHLGASRCIFNCVMPMEEQ
jgi:aquaporin Z